LFPGPRLLDSLKPRAAKIVRFLLGAFLLKLLEDLAHLLAIELGMHEGHPVRVFGGRMNRVNALNQLGIVLGALRERPFRLRACPLVHS
jgi:hypothetical protein